MKEESTVLGWGRALLAFLILAAAVVAGLSALQTPPAVRAGAAADLFSAERALSALAPVVARPHPTGTDADGAVRDYLLGRLTALGLDVSVQDATAVNDRWAGSGYPVVAGHVRNVIARRRGVAGAPAVLLMAHYDSRELAPGASDDGYGTAVLLECARALTASPPLRHDVLFVFTEGEEMGLLGAKAFVEENPLAGDAVLAINVDARGDRGAGQLFQTSDRASELVETLARVAPHTMATSLSQEVYRRMPNDTDLTMWLLSGRAGINLGNIDGFERYHQATDTLANAAPRTVQQLGDAVLALARAFADRDPVVVRASHDDVFFNAGPWLVCYDARAALPLAVLALSALLASAIVAARRRLVSVPGLAAGFGLAVSTPIAAGVIGLGLLRLAAGHQPDLLEQTLRDPVRRGCLAAALLIGAGVGWMACAAALRRVHPLSLQLGMALLPACLGVVAAARIPGASYPLLWPAAAAALACVLRASQPGLRSAEPLAVLAHVASPAIACVLFAPLAWQLGVAFGPGGVPVLAAIAALAVLPGAACAGTGSAVPARLLAAGLLSAGVALLGSAAAAPPYDGNAPRPDSLFYAIDDDAGQAYWLSVDDAPDAWTGRALGAGERSPRVQFFPRWPERRFLQARAQRVAHRGPAVAVVSDSVESGVRTLTVHVSTAPGAEAVQLLVPPSSHVAGGRIQGKTVGLAGEGWFDLFFAGPPPEGLDLVLTGPAAPFELTVVAQSRGLPEDAGVTLGPRPPGTMPEVAGPLRSSDMTLIAGRFKL